jgi:hypothetical protein
LFPLRPVQTLKLKVLFSKINPRLITILGLSLLGFSVFLFILIFIISFFPLSLTVRGALVSAFFIAGEITWWAGVALTGKKIFEKYRKYFNPFSLFKPTKTTGPSLEDQTGEPE